MRKERQQEIMAQLEAEKRASKKVKGLAFFRTLAVIYSLLACAFVAILCKLDVLPAKYLYGGIALLVFVSIFIVPVMMSKNGIKSRRNVAAVAAVLLVGVFGVGTYYLMGTVDFIENITQEKDTTEDYYVIVRNEGAESAAANATETTGISENAAQAETQSTEDISTLAGQTVATYMSHDLVYSEAKSKLQEQVSVEYAYVDAPKDAISKLLAGEYNAAFISAASYSGMKNSTDAEIEAFSIEENTKILYTISIPIETEDRTSSVDVTKEAFNIYISGSDMEGSIDVPNRTDVNMIATVNPVTHEVLLTSIPRDYYVELPTKGAKDKLTHSSLYGIQESIGAIENQLGIDINYYLRVNYSTIVKLVDAIGGIEIESDRDFYTSGMKGMPELNGHHFVQGINQVDGKLALAFCRERHAFSEGDFKRNENQQQVLEAIIKKCSSSTTILTKYTALLDAVKDNLATNMTADEMASIVKMQLDGMPSWTISKQSIKGTNNYEYCYALGFNASTVDPIPEEEMKAIDKIVQVSQINTESEEETTGDTENTGNTEETPGETSATSGNS